MLSPMTGVMGGGCRQYDGKIMISAMVTTVATQDDMEVSGNHNVNYTTDKNYMTSMAPKITKGARPAHTPPLRATQGSRYKNVGVTRPCCPTDLRTNNLKP